MDHQHSTAAPAAEINQTCLDCGKSQTTRYARGLCKTCYSRLSRALKRAGAFAKISATRPLRDRLLEKTTPGPGGCVIYTGHLNNNGYGTIGIGGKRGKQLYAHRAAYELFVGQIPEGLVLDHLCRVRRCINPHHLEPVTQGENVRRAVAAKAGGAR